MLRGRHDRQTAALLPAPCGQMASDDSQYSGSLYLSAAGIYAETVGKDGIDISLDTLLDNPDMAFRGADNGASVEVPAEPGSVFAFNAAASRAGLNESDMAPRPSTPTETHA